MLKGGFSFKTEVKWILFSSLAVPVAGLVLYFIGQLIR